MAGVRFDILFAGELMADADPEKVRNQLREQFKLSAADAQRLFSGNTVTIKRGVDAATASRYRKAFRDAQALIEIRPVDAPSEPPPVTDPEPTRAPTGESALESALETGDGDPRERAHTEAAPALDISHLSLVPGNDWTLEDCQPPPPPVIRPDISHLEIVDPESDADAEHGD